MTSADEKDICDKIVDGIYEIARRWNRFFGHLAWYFQLMLAAVCLGLVRAAAVSLFIMIYYILCLTECLIKITIAALLPLTDMVSMLIFNKGRPEHFQNVPIDGGDIFSFVICGCIALLVWFFIQRVTKRLSKGKGYRQIKIWYKRFVLISSRSYVSTQEETVKMYKQKLNDATKTLNELKATAEKEEAEILALVKLNEEEEANISASKSAPLFDHVHNINVVHIGEKGQAYYSSSRNVPIEQLNVNAQKPTSPLLPVPIIIRHGQPCDNCKATSEPCKCIHNIEQEKPPKHKALPPTAMKILMMKALDYSDDDLVNMGVSRESITECLMQNAHAL